MAHKIGRPRLADGLPDTLSRQRRYQLRQRANGCCAVCGTPVNHYAGFCDIHRIQVRQAVRRRRGHREWQPGQRGREPIVFDDGDVNQRRVRRQG